MSTIREALSLTVPGEWAAFHLDRADMSGEVVAEVEALIASLADPTEAIRTLWSLIDAAVATGGSRLAVYLSDGAPSSVMIDQRSVPLPDLVLGFEGDEVAYAFQSETGMSAPTVERIAVVGGTQAALVIRRTKDHAATSEFWLLTPTGREVLRVRFSAAVEFADEIHQLGLDALTDAEWLVSDDGDPEVVPDAGPQRAVETDESAPFRVGGPVGPPRDVRVGADDG